MMTRDVASRRAARDALGLSMVSDRQRDDESKEEQSLANHARDLGAYQDDAKAKIDAIQADINVRCSESQYTIGSMDANYFIDHVIADFIH